MTFGVAAGFAEGVDLGAGVLFGCAFGCSGLFSDSCFLDDSASVLLDRERELSELDFVFSESFGWGVDASELSGWGFTRTLRYRTRGVAFSRSSSFSAALDSERSRRWRPNSRSQKLGRGVFRGSGVATGIGVALSLPAFLCAGREEVPSESARSDSGATLRVLPEVGAVTLGPEE